MTDPDVVPTVSYFLVLLHPAPDAGSEPPWGEHVAFIDTMVSRGVVLLGGDLDPPVAGADAAYLLHTATRQDAEAWARKDPLVRQGHCGPDVIEWRLVGIALDAIHPALRMPPVEPTITAEKGPNMSTESTLISVVSVLPVADHSAAVAWYAKWIGRAPDVEPMEGVAEWQLAPNAWIQVSVEPESAGRTTVVLGVAEIDAQRAACEAAGVSWGDVNDYGFVKTAEAVDPAGNKIVFVQDLSDGGDGAAQILADA